jgi:hypothetical protein
MREDLLIQRAREALRKWAAKSPQERFDEMVRRGVIDAKGRVLKRCPVPPKKKRNTRSSDGTSEADNAD